MYKLSKSDQKDLPDIAHCHRLCFKNSLSTQLGTGYLIKSFQWFLSKNNCFLFQIKKDDIVVGYCGGFVPQYLGDGSTSGMMQYAMKKAILGLILHPWLLLNKEVIAILPLAFKNFLKRLVKKKSPPSLEPPVPDFEKRVGLVVIGVHPAFRGSGIFQELMKEFEATAISLNITKLVLSVKKGNARAIRAYSKQGWFIAKEHRQSIEMYKHLY